MFSKNRNDLESWEDYNQTAAGRAILKMPELFEEGTYPKNPEAPAALPAPEPPVTKSVVFKPKAAPDPFKQTFTDPFKAGTAPSSGVDYGAPTSAPEPNDPLDQLMDAFRIQQAITGRRESQLKNSSLNSVVYKPAAATSPVTTSSIMSEATPAPYKKAELRLSQYPYEAVGELLQLASDKVRTEIAEPVARKVVNAVKNKQPANPAEYDMVENAGKLTQAMTKAVGDTYTRDNVIKATNAIHQGETEGKESDYNRPVSADDVMSTIHGGDTW